MGLLDYLTTGGRQLGKVADARFPVGNLPLPGGYVLNDALRPFTDSRPSGLGPGRGDGAMLPPDTSINDIGRSFESLSPSNVVNSHYDAIGGAEYGTGRPLGLLERLGGLFPAAGAEGGGLLAPATARGSTTLGTFAGRRALSADLDALARAEAMEAARRPAATILKDTGWMRGHDGEWRFEISDHDAAVGIDARGNPRLDHPGLREAYPDLARRLNVQWSDELGGSRGAYDHDNSSVLINRSVSDPEQQRLVVLHELQHAIQEAEGFSPGTAPNAAPIVRIGNNEILRRLTAAQKAMSRYETALGEFAQARGFGTPGTDFLSIQRDFQAAEPHLSKQYRDANRDYETLISGRGREQVMVDTYRRAMGEYEARESALRRDMTPERRRATPPYEQFHLNNVPRDLLIDMRDYYPETYPGHRPRRAWAGDPAHPGLLSIPRGGR